MGWQPHYGEPNKTRWKKVDSVILGMKCFSDEIGVFTVKKIEKCKEYCESATTPDGSHWFETSRAFITTNTGLKYVVPYIWLVFHSTNMDGKILWKIIDNVK